MKFYKDRDPDNDLGWWLMSAYREYLKKEKNLEITFEDLEKGVIPFGYGEIMNIFDSVSDYCIVLAKSLDDLEKDSHKELFNYEERILRNANLFCKKYIKQFMFKYENLSDSEKNNLEGYKKALLSYEEFIKIFN